MSVLPTKTTIMLAAAAALSPALALAQPPGRGGDGPPPPRDRRGRPAEGPGIGHPHRPGPPIMVALDTNRDGELSPDEIQSAAAALKSLDRNHDGILDRSELEPTHAERRDSDEPLGGPPAYTPGGPPSDRADGPHEDRPPPRSGPGQPAIGHVLPPFVRDELSLTGLQQKQLADLESTVKSKLESILTPRQLRQLRLRLDRGPGDRPGLGGPGPRNRGGPPRGGDPEADDEPPVRPRRP